MTQRCLAGDVLPQVSPGTPVQADEVEPSSPQTAAVISAIHGLVSPLLRVPRPPGSSGSLPLTDGAFGGGWLSTSYTKLLIIGTAVASPSASPRNVDECLAK